MSVYFTWGRERKREPPLVPMSVCLLKSCVLVSHRLASVMHLQHAFAFSSALMPAVHAAALAPPHPHLRVSCTDDQTEPRNNRKPAHMHAERRFRIPCSRRCQHCPRPPTTPSAAASPVQKQDRRPSPPAQRGGKSKTSSPPPPAAPDSCGEGDASCPPFHFHLRRP